MEPCRQKSQKNHGAGFARILISACLIPIRLYQFLISPLLGRNCRFEPSCSCYAEQALREHGACRGGYLAVRRLLRCHPWHTGGYDPVPTTQKRAIKR